MAAQAASLQIRVATYNASLNRDTLGQLATDLAGTTNTQARQVAETLQRIAPDIVLINEFDVDPTTPATRSLAMDRFHNNYLAISQNGQPALNYPYRYAALSNTGVPTGATTTNDGDFDNNGSVVSSYTGGASTTTKNNYGNDSFGFGWFPGQYSFVVYSKYPIQAAGIRTFRLFKWRDMPGNAMPPGYYTAAEQAIFRLSSKNHVVLPIQIKTGQSLQLLASHPTPPSFDGAEDRNGRRNHDEIRLWKAYLDNAAFLTDDDGLSGGMGTDAGDPRFIILGDLNADPLDGDSHANAIQQLRTHPLVNAAPNPSSNGGPAASAAQAGKNSSHLGNPAYDTADFGDSGSSPGNLRVDYILPSKAGFNVTASGVFWPAPGEPGVGLIGASDHRAVWMDLTLTPVLSQCVRSLTASRNGNDTVLTWVAQAGITYRVQWSQTLQQWHENPAIPITISPTTLQATAIDIGGATAEKKYYRIVATLTAD